MDPLGAGISFVIIWWLGFFCVLPVGIRARPDEDKNRVTGCQQGAPQDPMIAKKALWATLAAIMTTLGLHLVLSVTRF